LLIALLFIPVILSNRPETAFLGIVTIVVVFFFPGYFLLTFLSALPDGSNLLIGPIFGIVCVTTAYDLVARLSLEAYFIYFLVPISTAGIVVFIAHLRRPPEISSWTIEDCVIPIAGACVALAVAPLYWRSGRFAGGEFVFYGPAGQDHLYHVTLLQRLMHHVPPDNFIVSGLRAPIYHYFDDLTLGLVLQVERSLHFGLTNLFDLYYRCYPTVIYFLIGALAYRAGKQLAGSARGRSTSGGILGVLLLLGAGGLGWIFGGLQTAAHAGHLLTMRAKMFSNWTTWDGVDSLLPLVHRPAHYHSLLICLAAINVLLQSQRSRRHWVVAGLLLGLMAGFNFTLAATFGIATVVGSLLFLLRRRKSDAIDLAWLALFILIGSLPVTVAMVLSGFHNTSAGFPFRGPNLEYPISVWGELLHRMLPSASVPWAALVIFPIILYGVKLFGVRAMAGLRLGEENNLGIALILIITFLLSLVIGTFFPYQGLGGVAVIFLQPTLWILGLFAIKPVCSWLASPSGNWRPIVLWGTLGLTCIQALVAFNFSDKASLSRDAALALWEIRDQAAPDDVVAYIPSSLNGQAIWGTPATSTNFAIMAMTGLDGYFSSETYTEFFAVPGLSGRDPADVLAQAERLYGQRRDTVDGFLKGDRADLSSARLRTDHVRWVVLSGDAAQSVSPSLMPWRRTQDLVFYRLP